MDDLLDTLHATRTLWLPSIVLILSATASLALIAWGGFSIFADDADAARSHGSSRHWQPAELVAPQPSPSPERSARCGETFARSQRDHGEDLGIARDPFQHSGDLGLNSCQAAPAQAETSTDGTAAR
jgi:hypothetical protein